MSAELQTESSKISRFFDGVTKAIQYLGWCILLYWIIHLFCFEATHRQHTFAVSSGVDDREFLQKTCDVKRVCAKYSRVLQTCATAGSIGQCIDIKMSGESYDSCAADGSTTMVPKELLPSYAQCVVR
jgi:hypothetical protein